MFSVLLMNFGGPPNNDISTLEQYIYNILSDRANWPWKWSRFLQPFAARAIARKRAPMVATQYAAMGGSSPLVRISDSQMARLAAAFSGVADAPRLFLGMQNWPPFIEQVLEKIVNQPHSGGEGGRAPTSDGAPGRMTGRAPVTEPVSDLFLLPLYPHRSVTTTEACFDRVEKWWKKNGNSQIQLHHIGEWYANRNYLELCATLLRETLEKFSAPSAAHVLFTAHSLPQRTVDDGDVYPDQVRKQVNALIQLTGIQNRWSLGFQSRLGPVKWLEPDVETCIASLAHSGVKSLCLMPLSFVADQLETLYEVDVTYVESAKRHGITETHRVPVVNDHPAFIEVLKELILNGSNG